MDGEWKETTLADVSSDISYGYTESASTEKVGPHFLRITDIQNGIVDWDNVPYCTISEANHRKYRLQTGDIVVARTGNSTGENFLYRGDKDAVYASYLIRFQIDRQKADPAFIWYNLRSDRWWSFINNSKTGSAQAGANAKTLGLFPINLPPLSEQRTIADILEALDDKIELNRRMNQTLEFIARALFKSWFVDFDPVRAKMEGREPEGLSPEIAALFPDRLVDSEMGEIPEGWIETSVYSCAEYINGASYKNIHFTDNEGALPIIKIAELKNGVGQNTKFANSKFEEKTKINTGDILLSWSGSPETSIDTFLWVGGQALLNQHIFKVVNETIEKRTFTFFLLKHLKPVFIDIAKDKQTTGLGHFTVQDLKRLKITYPSEKVLSTFSKIATPLLKSIQSNLIQTSLLGNLRDTLLPKLISGELRVGNVSSLKEAV